MAAESGTRHGVHGQAADADRWRVLVTPRWAALRTRRGGGERVKKDRASAMNGYRWGGVKRDEAKEKLVKE